jgi:MFS family permease
MYGLLPESRKGLAGALVLGVAGLGNAAGPLLGGVITAAIDWRWVLVLNLPIAAAAILVVIRTVGETRDEGADRRFDWLGTVTLSAALVLLLIALDQVDTWGWGDPRVTEAGGNAGQAFVDGLQTTLRVSGALAVAGFLVALLFVGRGTRSDPLTTPQPSGGTT